MKEVVKKTDEQAAVKEAEVEEKITTDEVKNDIADLLGISSATKIEVAKEKEQETSDKEESVEEETVEEEVSDVGKEDEVEKKEEPEQAEEGVEEEKEEDVDFALQEIARLGELLAGDNGKDADATEEKEVAPEEKKEEPEKKVEIDTSQFLSPDDFPDFTDKEKSNFNQVLNNVYAKALGDAQINTFKDITKVLPNLIEGIVRGHLAAQEFWAENPGLKTACEKYPGLKQYVVFRSNEIQEKNKKWTLGQVYNQVSKEVKQVLGDRLKEDKAGEETISNSKVSFARRPNSARKGARTKSSDGGLTSIQKEIKELMEN